jgi:hypothetical protein
MNYCEFLLYPVSFYVLLSPEHHILGALQRSRSFTCEGTQQLALLPEFSLHPLSL